MSAAQDAGTRSTARFEPTIESLRNYRTPDWFRDAKFGVYVHWGVYSVAERGEWYARDMYEEGGAVYRHHVRTWGHPSKFGYKDFIPLWKAEKFDADAWLALFKQAGARYFTPCAIHHDGFSLGRSQYTPYNAVQMGPKRDLLGELREATLRHGLRWGVTTHFDRTLSWIQPAHGADARGELAGVPYDGADPRYQDLYLHKYYDGNRADTENPPVWWREYCLLRHRELIELYKPDFYYLDSAVPFAGEDQGRTGLRLFAEFYNANMSWHDGRQEGVMTHKGDKGPKRAPFFANIATYDIERGKSGRTRDEPWQTDDSIGPWGYNPRVQYKDANAVVDKLIDIVSKNGNLLLNVPPRADGTLDDETVALLKRVGQWLAINGEAIYATRPWKVFGEGPDADMGDRDTRSPYSAAQFRFTTSKDRKTLYAIQMGAPEPGTKVVLASFASGGPGGELEIEGATLLGADGPLRWTRTGAGLEITGPATAPDDLAVVYALKLANPLPR
ncbi:MAG TPA: alpha-L-fucosidase [Lacipirellulaceae bacterium]|nr:alpha-L-fucosidase [Lacipirellulaceae bacterium]